MRSCLLICHYLFKYFTLLSLNFNGNSHYFALSFRDIVARVNSDASENLLRKSSALNFLLENSNAFFP